MKRALILLILSISQVAFSQDKSQEIEAFFNRYLEMLKAENYSDALNCWALLDRTVANQLRLQYPNEPVKPEIGSVLWQNIDGLRAGTATLTIDTIRFSREFASISYTAKSGSEETHGKAYAISEFVNEPQLVSPLRVFCESWEEINSRFMKVQFRDPSLFQQSALDDADEFIEATGKRLGISNEKMLILETIKFNAFLCESYGEVEQVSGKIALGAMIPSMDAVVSRYMPPYHEISQFLVNYAIPELPAYTLPIMKYGTATFLGGRWGRTPEVLGSLGAYLYANELATIDSIITAEDFAGFENNPDFAYPLAGLFCEYLWNQLGREKYIELYKQLSGSQTSVNSITETQFKQAVATSLGKDWDAVVKGLDSSLSQEKYIDITPGSTDEGKLVFESGLSSMLVRILEDSSYYNVIVNLKKDDAQGTLLLAGFTGTEYKSFLFGEQFTDTSYANQVYGLRFSPLEAGTYNYYTNEITGKYIVGVTADQPLTDKDGKSIRFRVQKRLLDGFEKFGARLVEGK